MRHIFCFYILLFTNALIAQPLVPVNILENEAHDFRLHYNMLAPDVTFELPSELDEISGLSMSSDGSKLVAVQDEDGIVYFINKTTGEIERDYTFYKEGDYEGVEMIGSSVFVVKSNGKIYEIHKIGQGRQQTIKFTTPLNKEYDVEGLGYDPKRECLLLACKAVGPADDEPILEKSIYGFDLKTRTLIPEPIHTLRLQDVQEYLKENTHIHRYKKVIEQFSSAEENFRFSASAIALNPRTGNYYALSSKGKMMGVVNPEGKILHIEKLDKTVHRQPEGICFDKDGTMYLSNEAKEGKAVIYRFDYQP